MEGTVRFENNAKCTIDMPTFMPPSPPGTAQEQKNHCQPCKKKEPGTPRNVLYSLPIGISDDPGFRVVGARINIRLKRKPRTAGTVVKCQFLLKWCKNLEQGFRQNRRPRGLQSQGRAGFSAAPWNPVRRAQALADVPYVGPVFGASKTSMSGLVAVGPHCAQLKTCCRIGG